ncbi:hypothetical protein AMYX_25850 [Anaeromyxobacter diazotrophicus]|uniref:Uncharacterized protein n=1 Tax=Anaeromyxobacter diazotrophicus TaxID=2590199 RepID=A0A7I9VN61_9BACT|nr:hypothetical protein AMYX_25850 [Anaeromyxobacter diazotrophicus]
MALRAVVFTWLTAASAITRPKTSASALTIRVEILVCANMWASRTVNKTGGNPAGSSMGHATVGE